MALGHLVMSCGNLVFIDLIEHLLTELGRNDNMSTTRTYIQCTAAISRQAGHRIGETAQTEQHVVNKPKSKQSRLLVPCLPGHIVL